MERARPGDPVVEEVIELFARRGAELYVGEAVSQQDHALQTAELAERAGAGSELIVAALLHDVGHLLTELPQDCARQGIDDHHEGLGARWLAARFGRAVSEPVRLHVLAKRCLCATDPVYAESLSPASARSLALQGGPLDRCEVESFRAEPFARGALQLRAWDDLAKVPGRAPADLGPFRAHLLAARRRRAAFAGLPAPPGR